MSWLYLVLAIGCEVVGTTCMKLSAGFTRPWPLVGLFVAYAASLAMLTLAIKGHHVRVA